MPVNPMDLFLWREGADSEVDTIVGWLPPGVRSTAPAFRVGPPIRYKPPALLMAQHHPLAGRDVVDVDVEDLADYEVIEPVRFDGVARQFDGVARQWVPETTPAGRPTRRVNRHVGYLELLLSEVRDHGLTHLTIRHLDQVMPLPGLTLVPMTGRAVFSCRSAWQTASDSQAVQDFARVAARTGTRAGWLDDSEDLAMGGAGH